MFSILGYLALFFSVLPITLYANDIISNLIVGQEYGRHLGFLMMYLLLLPFCNTTNKKKWWVFAVLHGMAHIVHPAFYGTTPNSDYTPFWDYIVHATSCLFIYDYHRTPLSKYVGFAVFYSTLIVGYYAHCDKSFLETTLWRILSAGGVLGSMYHMLLLDSNTDNLMYITCVLIWFGPYFGYTNMDFIPTWDYAMNSLGLFNLWFWNFFVTLEILNWDVDNKAHDE